MEEDGNVVITEYGKQEERSTRLRDDRCLVGTECDALGELNKDRDFLSG